jgi:hypothetical protein
MTHAQKPDFVFRRNGRVHLNGRGDVRSVDYWAAEVCASALVILDTPCSEVVWRVLATHCIHRFLLHLPSRASPCAITFQLDSTNWTGRGGVCVGWEPLGLSAHLCRREKSLSSTVTEPWIIQTITTVTTTTTTTTTTNTTSVVSITTRLRAGRTSVRIPAEDTVVARHVQTGSWAHPTSISKCTGSPSQGTAVREWHEPYGTVYEVPTWLIADGCNTDLLL